MIGNHYQKVNTNTSSELGGDTESQQNVRTVDSDDNHDEQEVVEEYEDEACDGSSLINKMATHCECLSAVFDDLWQNMPLRQVRFVFVVALSIALVAALMQTTTSTTSIPTTIDNTAWLNFDMGPYHGPASLNDTLDRCASGVEKCYTYICRGSGFGGQLMSLFGAMLYVAKAHGRKGIIVDESGYKKYALANGMRFLPAYFTPRMALLDQPEDRPLMDRFIPGDVPYQDRDDLPQYALTQMARDDSPMWVTVHPGYHNDLLRYYDNPPHRNMLDLYHDLIPLVCPNMQFNNETWSRIQDLRQLYGFPAYLQLPRNDTVVSTNETTVAKRVGSVSFHIRRTDKVSQGSSPLFPAGVYLEKALSLAERDNILLTRCFIATDDYNVIAETEQALEALGDRRGEFCRQGFHYTPSSGHVQYRNTEDGAFIFLTELSILLETTYFVGTFNSNVGDLVALMRACPNLPHDATKHYAQSYGVDDDEWYFY